MDEPLPFGADDLDSQVSIVMGPPTRIRCFVRGCRELLEPARWYYGPVCPKHGIRCNSSRTFSYGDARRNIIVDSAVFGQRVLGHPDKYETEDFIAEKSEDALSWNVFRSFQKAGLLGGLAATVFGLPTAAEPQLYLWGLASTNDEFSLWKLLVSARQRFESALPVKRPPTEPDIALYLPGQYLALIEAKFTSENGVYQRGSRKDEKSLTLEELLTIYADPSLRCLDRDKALSQQRVHYQLWRNMVFAEWMAQQDGGATKAFHFNLVREGHEAESAQEFCGLMAAPFTDRFRRVTWESLYHFARSEKPRLDRLCTYMEKKTANLQLAFRLGDSPESISMSRLD